MNTHRNPTQKALFQIESSPSLRLTAAVIVSLVLMWTDHRHAALENLRQGLSVVIYPVRVLVDLPFTLYDSASESLSARSRLLDDNARLKTQALEDAARLQQLQALRAENARLRELLRSSARLGDRVLVAQIFEVDLDPFRHRVLLDRGTGDSVFPGQAVVDADGIMGQVTHVDPFSAEAILITDADHAVPVEVNRNGLRTIALGTGETDNLDLPFLPNNADIREGDLLVTSGLGGTFPRGYPVAEVVRVIRDPGEAFAQVSARPAAALNRSREVLLVWTASEALPAPAIEDDETTGEPDGD